MPVPAPTRSGCVPSTVQEVFAIIIGIIEARFQVSGVPLRRSSRLMAPEAGSALPRLASVSAGARATAGNSGKLWSDEG